MIPAPQAILKHTQPPRDPSTTPARLLFASEQDGPRYCISLALRPHAGMMMGKTRESQSGYDFFHRLFCLFSRVFLKPETDSLHIRFFYLRPGSAAARRVKDSAKDGTASAPCKAEAGIFLLMKSGIFDESQLENS